MNMKVATKLAISAVGAVVLAALSAIFIPYGAILSGIIGIAEGFYIRSLFNRIYE